MSTDATSPTAASLPTDTDRILDLTMAEIHAEADRLRREDPALAEYEREVTAAFDRLVPDSHHDVEASLSELEGLVPAQLLPPDTTPRPGRSRPKQIVVVLAARVIGNRIVERLLRLATSRMTLFNGAAVSFLRGMADRMDRLEDAVGTLSPEVAAEVARLPYQPPAPAVVEWVAAALPDTGGPVVHLGCGGGEVVRALARHGRSAYGVDERRGLHVDALREGVDVRGAAPLDHLRSLPDGSVATVVVDGFVDRLGLVSQIDLANQAARVVAPGGAVAVLIRDRSADSAVLRDLGVGRPLAPATWAFLLGHRLTDTVVYDGPEGTHLVVGTQRP
ncbi:MAG: methyltransferase domain-containing protein [Acidimicrobiales bacterium]